MNVRSPSLLSRLSAGLLLSTLMLLPISSGPARADDSLTVFDWAGYEEPEFHPAYVEKYGAGPTFAFFADEDEAFEKMYDIVSDQVDEVAERILMLGGTPSHNFSDYLKKNEIKESGIVSDGDEAMKLVLDYLKTLIAKERKIVDMASEANDEGTVSLIGDYILSQEKTVWLIASSLS